jgi:hypothetical protein
MLAMFIRILSLKSECAGRGARKPEWLTQIRLCAAVCVTVSAILVAGCGSSNIGLGAKAGSITVTNATGGTNPVNSLAIASAVKLSMMPSGDSINAGVDWTVTCGGNPVTGSITNGACGTHR